MNVNQAMLGGISPKNIGCEDPLDRRFASSQCTTFHLNGFGFGQRVPRSPVFMLLVLVALSLTPAWALRFGEQPGERIRVKKVLEVGKTNLLFFHAPWSKTSSRYLARLQKWSKSHSDTAVFVINIKNLKSPVSKQFKLKKVPAFRFYDSTGTLMHEGQKAHNKVVELLGE